MKRWRKKRDRLSGDLFAGSRLDCAWSQKLSKDQCIARVPVLECLHPSKGAYCFAREKRSCDCFSFARSDDAQAVRDSMSQSLPDWAGDPVPGGVN